MDGSGNLYVADVTNNVVRELANGASSFVVIAGDLTQQYKNGFGGSAPVGATSTGLISPFAVTVDNSGNVYILENGVYVRKIAAGKITTYAGSGGHGSAGDNGPALLAQFSNPQSLVTDASGNLYVADYGALRVRKILPGSNGGSGTITTFVGGGSHNGGSALGLVLPQPNYCAIDASGQDLYISDSGLNQILKVSNGIVTTFAGSGIPGFADGPAGSNALNSPQGIVLDSSGNLYIADKGNGRIRKVTPSGMMTTVAGNGSGWQPFDIAIDGSANLYILSLPAQVSKLTGGSLSTLPIANGVSCCYEGIAADASGNVYVTYVDTNEVCYVLKISGGVATTLADGLADTAGLTVDASGAIYVTDINHAQVQRLPPGGSVFTAIAGNGTTGYSGDGGPALSAELGILVSGLAVDKAGNVYIADPTNGRVRVAFAPAAAQTAPGVLLSFSPNSAVVGASTFTLKINGTGLSQSSVILWNGSPIPTTFVNPGQVTATVNAALLGAPGASTVSVEGSNSLFFYVLAPTISSMSP